MINSIAFTVYPVSDMARSKQFYEGALELKQAYNYQDEWVEYDTGGGTFAITTTEMAHLPGAKGAVAGFEVDDLDIALKALKEKSIPFVVDAFETPVCRMAVIADPDGNHIAIHKRK